MLLSIPVQNLPPTKKFQLRKLKCCKHQVHLKNDFHDYIKLVELPIEQEIPSSFHYIPNFFERNIEKINNVISKSRLSLNLFDKSQCVTDNQYSQLTVSTSLNVGYGCYPRDIKSRIVSKYFKKEFQHKRDELFFLDLTFQISDDQKERFWFSIIAIIYHDTESGTLSIVGDPIPIFPTGNKTRGIEFEIWKEENNISSNCENEYLDQYHFEMELDRLCNSLENIASSSEPKTIKSISDLLFGEFFHIERKREGFEAFIDFLKRQTFKLHKSYKISKDTIPENIIKSITCNYETLFHQNETDWFGSFFWNKSGINGYDVVHKTVPLGDNTPNKSSSTFASIWTIISGAKTPKEEKTNFQLNNDGTATVIAQDTQKYTENFITFYKGCLSKEGSPFLVTLKAPCKEGNIIVSDKFDIKMRIKKAQVVSIEYIAVESIFSEGNLKSDEIAFIDYDLIFDRLVENQMFDPDQTDGVYDFIQYLKSLPPMERNDNMTEKDILESVMAKFNVAVKTIPLEDFELTAEEIEKRKSFIGEDQVKEGKQEIQNNHYTIDEIPKFSIPNYDKATNVLFEDQKQLHNVNIAYPSTYDSFAKSIPPLEERVKKAIDGFMKAIYLHGKECDHSITMTDVKTEPVYSVFDPEFSYEIGKTIIVEDMDLDNSKLCSKGIHVYPIKNPAIEFVTGLTCMSKNFHNIS